MSTDTRAELNTKVIQNILDGNNRTTAAQLRYVLNRMIVSLFNLSDDVNLLSGGTFKGDWENTATYQIGDVVISGLLLWKATASNSGELPGSAGSWLQLITNDDAFSPGMAGSILGVTQNRFYQVITDLPATLDDIYYKLNGAFPLEGNMDAISVLWRKTW